MFIGNSSAPSSALAVEKPEPPGEWAVHVALSVFETVNRDILHAWLAIETFARSRAVCWPSNATLAARLGVAGPGVAKAILLRLEDLGIIRREHSDGNRRKIHLLRRTADPLPLADWHACLERADQARDARAAAAELAVDQGADQAAADLSFFGDRGACENAPPGADQEAPPLRRIPKLANQQQGPPAAAVAEAPPEEGTAAGRAVGDRWTGKTAGAILRAARGLLRAARGRQDATPPAARPDRPEGRQGPPEGHPGGSAGRPPEGHQGPPGCHAAGRPGDPPAAGPPGAA